LGANDANDHAAPGKDHASSGQAQTSRARSGETSGAARRQASSAASGETRAGCGKTGGPIHREACATIHGEADTPGSRIPGQRRESSGDSGFNVSREYRQASRSDISN
jgi:hypothetical protein